MRTRTMNKKLCETIEIYIIDFIDKRGFSPTIAEISEGTEIPYSTVGRYLKYMRSNGMIYYEGHRSIITKETKKTNTQTIRVPVLGSVSCGIPNLAEENVEEYVRLPVSLFGTGDFVMLRANGESMMEAGIDDGNLVLIRQQNYAEEGQIVVALIEDEATLKRYYPEPEKHRYRLHPENSTMQDIYVTNCIIQGVAVKVLKDLE